MQELRILNGYHRGATLPLPDQQARTLGAHEDADVVLADPGILARHASLALTDGGWTLSGLDGGIRSAQSNHVTESLQLALGEFARADRIWLTVVDDSAPWSDPPPEPVDTPEPVPAPVAADEALPETDGERIEPVLQEDTTTSEPVAAQEPAEAVPELTPRRSRSYRMVLIPFFVATALTAAAAYGLTSHPEDPTAEARARETELKRLASLPRHVSQTELEAALRKRLGEVDLLYRVMLDLDAQQWTIRGALSEDDADRLQRMLRAFAKSYVIDFPITVKIGTPESMLPFRISQVITGNDPSIVTDDGRRLYVGDEYRGMRLAAVAGNQLKFTGKHALNVSW